VKLKNATNPIAIATKETVEYCSGRIREPNTIATGTSAATALNLFIASIRRSTTASSFDAG
jgi:hypothetical protein